MSMHHTSPADFGANQWLVEELFQAYQADPDSVDVAWHDFFVDYRPEPAQTNGAGSPAPGSNGSNGSSAPPAQAPPATDPAPPVAVTPVEQPATRSPLDKTPAASAGEASSTPLRGAAARVVTNMESSLSMPTATSVRAVPAKLLSDNRVVLNNHLARARGGKVSFTHLIGYALLKALTDFPLMNASFAAVGGKPALVTPEHINLGLAIDLKAANGTRSLVVASVKGAEAMDFAQFWQAYEDIIRRARTGKLTADDFAATTISLTNPGTIGTVHSVPRLMAGQGAIIGVGAMEYPAEFAGMSADALAANAISKTITLTSTYDHRIIQGAQSGDFLRRMHGLLLGEDGFYDEIFASLRVPYEPVRWTRDVSATHEGQIDKQARVIELIHSYRVRGHLMADTDPLEFKIRSHPDLDIIEHGLTLWDLDREFPVGGFAGERVMKLRDILGVLRDSYCRTVGVEYMHIQDPDQRSWLQERIETPHARPDRDEQIRILAKLNQAEAFEHFLQTKYVGQKRFSLEGGESVIPLVDAVIDSAARAGLDEVVIGMPHRGRLNVLANLVGKSYGQIFREFEGNVDPTTVHGSGDVKYHLGATGTYHTPEGGSEITVSLTSNPSHLEAVDPVVEGIVRAKQDIIDKGQAGFTVLPLMMHGDAAFAGQGVVAETLNLSQLRGYRTGGTVHVVVNNQVGFTTAPEASRSSVYSTDVARMVQAPIFHVNGDDPAAVVRVARLAFEFRQAFNKDVVIDMICYRRRGHNEGDDPSMTQPLMYDTIDGKRSVRKLYTEGLVGRGDITVADAESALRDYQAQLEKGFLATRDEAAVRESGEAGTETGQLGTPPPPDAEAKTAISVDVVKRIADSQVSWPDGFTVHRRLKPQLERRAAMASQGHIDWAMGELLAFGSVMLQGHPVRLSGQDSRRGTFAQRHAVLVDRLTGAEYTPLAHLDPEQARFWAYDSLLSEFAAMGFEYGYSVVAQNALVLWEAQFGDFVGGAQSIIDEFISSGEAKWGQRSAVVLLLPHGHEGQGPDHTSGRIERFLQLCAEDNMTVANCSTPASYFHLLRRQALSGRDRRPLVVFTPKSLLRNKAAVSSVEDFTTGSFAPVLDDAGQRLDEAAVSRVLLCSGKVYYDLVQEREKRGANDVAIVRLEQLYPLPGAEVAAALARYPQAADVAWVQEEPANQGAWQFIALNLAEYLPAGLRLRRVARAAAASPAAGAQSVHEDEQRAVVAAAFSDGDS